MTAYMPQSKTDVHITPSRVYGIIEVVWSWKKDEMFDPCPMNPDFDGLKISWHRKNYVNPPYDVKTLTQFVDKAIQEMTLAHYSIMLLPSKTDQPWFHKLINRKFQIEWIQGRLRFEDEKNNAPGAHFLVMVGLD